MVILKMSLKIEENIEDNIREEQYKSRILKKSKIDIWKIEVNYIIVNIYIIVTRTNFNK